MPEVPERLYQRERQADQHFDPDEKLYRRVPPELVDGDEIEADAVNLPDISVIRAKFGRPEDALFPVAVQSFEGWGVWFFRVQDVPDEMIDQHESYSFRVIHSPERKMYPHSEVQAFRNGLHVDTAVMPNMRPEFHLRFRNRLRTRMKVTIRPGEFSWE